MKYRTSLFCAICASAMFVSACASQQSDSTDSDPDVVEKKEHKMYTAYDWDIDDSDFIVIDNTTLPATTMATDWPVTYEPKTQKADSFNATKPFATTSLSRPTTEYSTTTIATTTSTTTATTSTATQENPLTNIAFEEVEETTTQTEPALLRLPWEQENLRRWARVDESSNGTTIYIRPNMRLLIDLPNFNDPEIVWANPQMLRNGRPLHNGGFTNERPPAADNISKYNPVLQMGSNIRVNPNNNRHVGKTNTRTFCYLNMKHTGVVRLRMHAVRPSKANEVLATYEVVLVIVDEHGQLTLAD